MQNTNHPKSADELLRSIADVIDPKAYDERLCAMKRRANVIRRQRKVNDKASKVLKILDEWQRQ